MLIKLIKIVLNKIKKYFFPKILLKRKKIKFKIAKYFISRFILLQKNSNNLTNLKIFEPFVEEVLRNFIKNNEYNITYILYNKTEIETYKFYSNLIQNLTNLSEKNINNFFIIDLISFSLLKEVIFIEDACDLISIIIAKFSIKYKNKKIILFIKPIEKIVDLEIKNEDMLKRINPLYINEDLKLVYFLNQLNKSLNQNTNIKVILSLNFKLKKESNNFQEKEHKIIDFSKPKITTKTFSSFLPQNYKILN